MWVQAVFDLPVKTRKQRLNYVRFRKKLLADGYTQFQFSVYMKHFSTLAAARASVKKLGQMVPDNGRVCFFYFTDRQYGLAQNFHGKYAKPEDMPERQQQAVFFGDDGDQFALLDWRPDAVAEQNDGSGGITSAETPTPQQNFALDQTDMGQTLDTLVRSNVEQPRKQKKSPGKKPPGKSRKSRTTQTDLLNSESVESGSQVSMFFDDDEG